MTMYNLTNLTNAQYVSDVALFSNQVTGGLLFSLGILSLFFIMLYSFRNLTFEKNLMISSFLCFILSVFLTMAHLLSFFWAMLFLVLLGLAAFLGAILPN